MFVFAPVFARLLLVLVLVKMALLLFILRLRLKRWFAVFVLLQALALRLLVFVPKSHGSLLFVVVSMGVSGLLLVVGVGPVLMPMLADMDVKLDSGDALFLASSGVQVVFVQAQLGELVLQLVEIQPQIQQRPDEHIAADAAEEIQVEGFHGGTLSVEPLTKN